MSRSAFERRPFEGADASHHIRDISRSETRRASIHLPPIIPPTSENRLQIQQGARPLPHFSVGQILEARVLGRLDGEQLLLSIQGQSLVARTAIPLQAGEHIRLKVEGLNPLLTLVLLKGAAGESARTGEVLQSMRTDPSGLAKCLAGLLEALDPENPGALRTLPAKADAGRILQLLQDLVLPKNTVENPLWIKDCLQSLGLLLESDVRKEFQGGSSTGFQERAVSLKELLLNLIEVLQKQGDGEEGKGLSQKLSLFEGALKNIENLQVLNVLFQEQEGKYLLQIPFLLSGRMTTADIFVYVDQENQQRKRGSEGYRVAFALHMDALGDIMIQAKWKGKNWVASLSAEASRSGTSFVLRLPVSRSGSVLLDFRWAR